MMNEIAVHYTPYLYFPVSHGIQQTGSVEKILWKRVGPGLKRAYFISKNLIICNKRLRNRTNVNCSLN